MELVLPPTTVANSCCEDALQVLRTTYETCRSFQRILIQVMQDRSADGGPTASEQDLLRAVLVFASSGVDAMIKQLIKDALPSVLDANRGQNGAAANFAAYVQSALAKDSAKSSEVLARSLTSIEPRSTLIIWFQRELTASSLQSKDQIFQIASYFDVPSDALCASRLEHQRLTEVFRVRNKIIHEMDIDFSLEDHRTDRTSTEVIEGANLLMSVAANFLREVDRRVDRAVLL